MAQMIAAPRPAKKERLQILPYVLVTPTVFITLLIIFWPMVEAMFLSLHQFVLFRPNQLTFVGLGNFVKAFNDEVFWISVGNTLMWIGLTIPLQVLLGLTTAVLLNRKFFWRPVARALIIIPWALPSVVIALMWRWIYDPSSGVLNDILLRIGLLSTSIPWLSDPDYALYAIILTMTWQGFPFFAVMLLAALQAVPQNLYEAAAIDGASPWQQFRRITLPAIAPVIATSVLLRIVWTANSIDVIYVMTQGGPGYATHTLPLYAFIKARTNLDFGYGSALAILFTLMLAVVVYFYLRRNARVIG